MKTSNRLRQWFEFPERLVLFVLGLIYSSSLNFYIMSILMTFLTDIWNLNLKRAAIIMNVQAGLTDILKIFVRFFIDSLLGDRWMLIFSSIMNILGFVLLRFSVPQFLFNGAERYCSAQEAICYAKLKASALYIGLAFITVGSAAQWIPLETLPSEGLKQKPKAQRKFKEIKLPCFISKIKVVKEERKKSKNVIRFLRVAFMLGGVYTGINVLSSTNWISRFLLSAITMVVGLLLFLCGIPFYPPPQLQPSPLSTTLRVFVAAMWKWDLNYQENTTRPYYGDEEEQTLTNHLGWLNKAAIQRSPTDDEVRSWRLCTVKEVEQTKTLLGIIPMALTFITYGMVNSVGNTFFIEQANKMDQSFGSTTSIPIASFSFFAAISSSLVNRLYVMTLEKRISGTNKRYSDGMKIGLGMLASTICCTVASWVEAKRLKILRERDLLNNIPDAEAPMSVLWLLPQFFFMGAMDGLGLDGIKDFFGHNVPHSMRRYGPIFTQVLIGYGVILSIGFEVMLDQYNKFKGRASWIQSSINQSRLDYFYRALTAVTIVNLFFFAYIATAYPYKDLVGEAEEEALEEKAQELIELQENEEEEATERRINRTTSKHEDGEEAEAKESKKSFAQQ